MYQGLLRLLYIIRQQFPQFLNTYKLVLNECVWVHANQLRNLLLPPNLQLVGTDDFTGMLSLPECDLQEVLVANVDVFGPILGKLEDYGAENAFAVLKFLREQYNLNN